MMRLLAISVAFTAALVCVGIGCAALEHALRPHIGANWSNVVVIFCIVSGGVALTAAMVGEP